MKILALETANEQCSVAIVDATQTLFFEHHHEARMQTQQILPMIERGLAESKSTWQDISAIAFSRGPGSFSGVRINAAVTQALAWANDLSVIPVSTLQALAQHAYQQSQFLEVTAVIDARMNEVYFGQFAVDDHGIMQLHGVEQLLGYDQAMMQLNAPFDVNVVGTGANLLGHTCAENLYYANAIDIAEIAKAEWLAGRSVSADQALPVYLRDNAWKKIAEQGKS